MTADALVTEPVVELVFEYLSLIFANTVQHLVEPLLDFDYICYAKNYDGVGDFSHGGFQDEVCRTTLDESTPDQFGFIKSFSNLNWYCYVY